MADADGEVWLHCYPRVLGFTFKPVSFWYCHRRDDSLAAIVVEVNNTFGERHCYLLQPGTGQQSLRYGQELRAAKVFHVSPFCAIEGGYRFRFMRTGDRTVARIDHHDSQGLLLQTSVSGAPCRPHAGTAARRVLRHADDDPGCDRAHPLAGVRLWAKRVPFLHKPEPPRTFVTR